jgi:enamine deaminase RidA (YjgF/YER057c/UK114 family)
MTVTPLMIPGLPPPVSHYADATIANGFVFLSGVTAAGPDGLVGAGDITAQTEYVFDVIGKVLAGAGADFVDITKVTVYLTNMDDRVAVNEVRKRVFGTHRPASTLLEVSRFVVPGTMIEIEAIAALPNRV